MTVPIHVWSIHVCICMYTDMHKCVCTDWCRHICVHACIYGCVQIGKYVARQTWICICVYVYMYECTFICIYVCLCACICKKSLLPCHCTNSCYVTEQIQLLQCKYEPQSHYAIWKYRSKMLTYLCQKQATIISTSNVIAIYVPATNVPLKYHIYATY